MQYINEPTYYPEGVLKESRNKVTGTRCRSGQLNHKFVEQQLIADVWTDIGGNDAIAGEGCRFREGVRDGDYVVDVELEVAGFLLAENDGWENIGGAMGSYVPLDFLTTNTAAQNVTALNDALTNHRFVEITTPGVYELDDTVFIPSNTRLEFVAGCTIKKATGSSFSHVFVNKGILTRAHDTNINLIGNGLNINVNGIDNATGLLYGNMGHIGFFNVSNFNISGISTTSIDMLQFFLHLTKVDNFTLKNLDLEGWKDGIHLGDAHDFLMEDIRTCTGDDGIALNAYDYAISNETFGDIYNGTIRRWTDDYKAGQGGQGILMLTGSWTNWGNGVTYQVYDTVINNGRIYQKVNAGTAVSSVAPTHTSGSVTGVDGIAWVWKQDGIINHVSIHDITIENSIWASDRYFVGQAGIGDASFRPMFPTTSGDITDNIILDNITVSPVTVTKQMIGLSSNTGNLTIKNTIGTFGNNGISPVKFFAGRVALLKLTFDNCNLTLTQASDLLNLISTLTFELDLIGTVINNFNTIVHPNALSNVNININDDSCSFINKVNTLIWMENTTTSVINFVADSCTFEETKSAAFINNNAGSELNVTTTNSLGESVVLLNSGTVDITNCDLAPLGLGDNIIFNGKFRVNVNSWIASYGAIVWDATECLKFTADGTADDNLLRQQTVLSPLSNNLRITFRAKSPTATNVLAMPYNPSTIAPVINPALTANWQNYEFAGDRGSASYNLFIKFGWNLANGTIIYIDDIQVVQY